MIWHNIKVVRDIVLLLMLTLGLAKESSRTEMTDELELKLALGWARGIGTGVVAWEDTIDWASKGG
jgi:hypothetical protein